jgi:putative acetyltransferase
VKNSFITLKRTSSADPDFNALVTLLDEDLSILDGQDASFFAQFNSLDSIRHVVVAYVENIPAGCGAVKNYKPDTMEVKRMFVKPAFRRKGIAREILSELEKWTAELGCNYCILETTKRQPSAVALYLTSGYDIIPNYDQYANVESSVCMKKRVR